MGSTNSCPAVDTTVMRRGKTINHSQQVELSAEISELEIKQALFSMDDNKSPGVDGFTSCFLKKAWTVVKADMIKVVQKFFQKGTMLKVFNYTTITVVPKCPNPTSVRDFGPIACCTVIYKIISKILNCRLQNVMGEIVENNQSAFIPGRMIIDNIVLSHELVKGYNRNTYHLDA